MQPIGAAVSIEKDQRGITVRCTDGAAVRVYVLASDLIRVRARFAGQSDAPDHSWAISCTAWPEVAWDVEETADQILLHTGELDVAIQRKPLLVEFRDRKSGRVINADQRPMARNPKTGRVAAGKRLGLNEHFYGLGEKAARLDKRRGRFVMWNTDSPAYGEGTDPLYQSIPFYLGWQDGLAYGVFFDNSHRTVFDLGSASEDYAAFMAADGELNYYFFHGPSLKKVLSRYADLTGHMPLPPLWSLGHQQSRYSYYPDTRVEEIADEYRAHDLPLDVIHLDIDYMDGYRVFTWDRVRFPDPAGLTARLQKKGVRLITIIDPGVKYQPAAGGPESAGGGALPLHPGGYAVFDEGLAGGYFLRRKDGSLYLGKVWPGEAVFVDYTKEDARRWWGSLHRTLLDQGVAGIWTDMNEPSDFLDKTGETQADVVFDDGGTRSSYGKNRNTFALNMARATYEGLEQLQPNRRPFVITRAAYAGIQRYAVAWTGDNKASFESLALNLPMFLSMGMSGEPFVGSDIPGFIGRVDGELLVRAYQLAAFVPFCRNHAAVSQYDREPWRFGPRYEDMVRAALKLRYQLMPFLYTTLEEAHRTGIPLLRPLLLNFQTDPNTVNLEDQFMVGDVLLVAPVLRAGERARDVYLPAGCWYDYWTGTAEKGGTPLRVEAPLDRLPLWVRGGAILPATVPMNHTGEKPWTPLCFEIYPDADGNAAGSVYEDDGLSREHERGAYRRTNVSLHVKGGSAALTISAPEGNFQPPARQLELVVHVAARPARVLLDGRPLTGNGGALPATWDYSGGRLRVRVPDDGHAHIIEYR